MSRTKRLAAGPAASTPAAPATDEAKAQKSGPADGHCCGSLLPAYYDGSARAGRDSGELREGGGKGPPRCPAGSIGAGDPRWRLSLPKEGRWSRALRRVARPHSVARVLADMGFGAAEGSSAPKHHQETCTPHAQPPFC